MQDSELLRFELYTLMFERISQFFHEHNMNTMLFTFDPVRPVVPKMIRERHIDGLILPYYVPPEILAELEASRIPAVFVNSSAPPGAAVVLPDDRQGMSLAVAHLVKLGHRRILYLNKRTRMDHPSETTRMEAFFEAMRSFGLTPCRGSDTPLGGEETRLRLPDCVDGAAFLHEQLNEDVDLRPTAVISYSAVWLRNIMLAILRAGLRVPQDLSLVCFDQLGIVRDGIPSVTHVAIPMADMAHKACERLLSGLHGGIEAEPTIIVPEKLVVMESTAPPNGG
jgi:LacI family transcriptional regulator